MDDFSLRRALRRVFDEADENRSGTVSTAELKSLCVGKLKMRLSDGDLQAMVTAADPDGSGELDFDEVVPPPGLEPRSSHSSHPSG